MLSSRGSRFTLMIEIEIWKVTGFGGRFWGVREGG
jgi:hypothetical protein